MVQSSVDLLEQAEIDRVNITWGPECEGPLPSVMCGDVDCEVYHQLPPACHCYFARCNENCQVEDSFIEYVEEALCNPSHWPRVEIGISTVN